MTSTLDRHNWFETEMTFLEGLLLGLRASAKTTEIDFDHTRSSLQEHAIKSLLKQAGSSLMDAADVLAAIRREDHAGRVWLPEEAKP